MKKRPFRRGKAAPHITAAKPRLTSRRRSRASHHGGEAAENRLFVQSCAEKTCNRGGRGGTQSTAEKTTLSISTFCAKLGCEVFASLPGKNHGKFAEAFRSIFV